MSNGSDLTDLQLTLLRVLWERGEATTQEVHEALLPVKQLAPTTVATLLSRLERRGVLTHRREGRHHVYRPLVTERQVRRSKVQDLMNGLFGGQVSALMSHLVGSDDVEADELKRIRAMIDEAEERLGGESAANGVIDNDGSVSS